MESDDGDSRSARKKAPALKQKEVAKDKLCMWCYNFSGCVTMCVPDKCIRKDNVEAKQAWRENVAICFVVFLASSFFVGIFGFIPALCARRGQCTRSPTWRSAPARTGSSSAATSTMPKADDEIGRQVDIKQACRTGRRDQNKIK